MSMRRYVGFYWTLPVPWAGFQSLPDDVDEAAEQSRTIRYQRDLVRRWVAEENGQLIAEKVFLELQPDRATEYVEAPLGEAIRLCRESDACLVYVDFQERFKARPNQFLARALDVNELDSMALAPEEIQMDGVQFDPIEHFRTWRGAYKEHQKHKPDKGAKVHEEIHNMRESGATWAAVADRLNEQNLKTLNGKPWSADNVRKFAAGST